MKIVIVVSAGLMSTVTLERASGATSFLGPVPYLSFADSPFSGLTFTDYFHFEDFEDGLFNVPGVSATSATGAPFSSYIVGPSGFTDSVDGDDGVIDGSGTGGHSLVPNSNNAGVKFIFDVVVLGVFPTRAGFVWTEGQNTLQAVEFEAFDAVGVSLGTINANVGDTSWTGTTGEDRFFGIEHSGGISAIQIRTTSPVNGNAMEVDHLQYGVAAVSIPEPSRFLLLGCGLVCGLCVRGRGTV